MGAQPGRSGGLSLRVVDVMTEYLTAGLLSTEIPPWLGVPLLVSALLGGAYVLYKRSKW